MLTAETDSRGRATGEVRPSRCKMRWHRAAEAGHGRRVGDLAAVEASAKLFLLWSCLSLNLFGDAKAAKR